MVPLQHASGTSGMTPCACRALIKTSSRPQLKNVWRDMLQQKIEQSKQRLKQLAFGMAAEMPDALLDYLDPFLPPIPTMHPKQHVSPELDYNKLRVYQLLPIASQHRFCGNDYVSQPGKEKVEDKAKDSTDCFDIGHGEVPADLAYMMYQVQNMSGANIAASVVASQNASATNIDRGCSEINAGSCHVPCHAPAQEVIFPALTKALSVAHWRRRSTVTETDSNSSSDSNSSKSASKSHSRHESHAPLQQLSEQECVSLSVADSKAAHGTPGSMAEDVSNCGQLVKELQQVAQILACRSEGHALWPDVGRKIARLGIYVGHMGRADQSANGDLFALVKEEFDEGVLDVLFKLELMQSNERGLEHPVACL